MSLSRLTDCTEFPLSRSSEPELASWNVFSTQTDRLGNIALGIGSGVPKLQPVVEQSGSALFGRGAVSKGNTEQVPPTDWPHEMLNLLCEPSGVGPSACVELPPPMFRPPQVSVLAVAPVPSNALPHAPPGRPFVKIIV